MKILLLCNKSPYPPLEGGPIAMNMIVEGLVEAGHKVKVLAINSNKYFIDPGSIPAGYREKTGIELIPVDLSLNAGDAFLNLFSSRSYHVQRFISPDFRKKLEEILMKESFDIVQFEMLYMAPYLDTVRKLSGAKTVLRTHNIEHLIWKRVAAQTRNPLKKAYLEYLVLKLKRYECSVIRKFDGIAAITEKDARFFREITGDPGFTEKIISVPFGIDLEKFPEPDASPEFPSLFSIGSMDWIPNREGIFWFLEKAWPALHEQYPGLHFYIAGRHMPDELLKGSWPNVEVIGEVEDARKFMLSRAIMVVPLFSGSGIRIKIIEGMAAGRTIISTTIGAEGIDYVDGENILLADRSEDFICQVSRCVKDQAFCQRIGENAHRLIKTRYDRRIRIGELLAFYQKIKV